MPNPGFSKYIHSRAPVNDERRMSNSPQGGPSQPPEGLLSVPEVQIDAAPGESEPARQENRPRSGSVRILRNRPGSSEHLPQAVPTSTIASRRGRSNTVGAPEVLTLDSVPLPSTAHLQPSPAPEPSTSLSVPQSQSFLGRMRSGSEPPRSPLAQNASTNASEASTEENSPASPPKVKSRRRAFTQGLPGFSAALGSSTRVSPSEPRPTPEQQQAEQQQAQRREEMNQRVVDFLDAVDPEVSTVSTLNNIQNSLFIPNFGSWVNRGSLIKLSSPEVRAAGKYAQLLEEHEALEARGQSVDDRPPVEIASHGAEQEYARALEERRRVAGQPTSRTSLRPQSGEPPASLAEAEQGEAEKARERAQHPEQFDHQRVQASTPVMGRRRSVASALSSATGPKLRHRQTVRGDFAVLPPGVDWGDWTDEEKAELDDYVRHLLHSKKEKSKRVWRGFKKYFSTPLGAFVTIYSFLLFVWGLAWVLFIIGWINVGGRQAYFIEICDQILVALFALVGLGLIPWRAVDTYHMIYIAKYHRKILALRREKGLKELCDENDLPLERPPPQLAEEGLVFGHTPEEEHVLSPEDEAKFLHHQQAFAKSHSFYRPHETETHYAFPLDLMIVAVCLLDCHSIFQLALASSTWSISYHHSYKKILTSVVLSFSISVNITAGIVISIGDRRTRKREILEKKLIQSITEEAIQRRNLEKRVAQRQLEEEEEKAREGLRELKEASQFQNNIALSHKEPASTINTQSDSSPEVVVPDNPSPSRLALDDTDVVRL